jgi:hypothetical protein
VCVCVCVFPQLCYDLVLCDVHEMALFTWAVRLARTEARHWLRSMTGLVGPTEGRAIWVISVTGIPRNWSWIETNISDLCMIDDAAVVDNFNCRLVGFISLLNFCGQT